MYRNRDRAKRLTCLMCGASVGACFQAKWNHLIKKHPADFLAKLIPLIANPELARQSGARLAEAFRRRL
jgi:hypothetical protein